MSNNADAQWRELNRQVTEAMVANDYQRMSQLYFEMALQTYREGRGFRDSLSDSAKFYLLDQKRHAVISQVQVLTRDDSCPQCKKLKDAKFTIEDALQNMPLPQGDCSKEMEPAKPGWCRCLYLPVIDDTTSQPISTARKVKSGAPFNCSTAIVFVIILVLCGCALLWYVPQLAK